ncbi:MAG: GNAT family N-acetyltransferase [Candidatus Atribacteria bacterium]|nr:GNAT family N-acetyltransferase [Candidatus Atribacteria bacterium]
MTFTSSKKVLSKIKIRDNFQYGDLGKILTLHGEVYQKVYGFDHSFEGYVAEGLAEFALTYQQRPSRLWIAEEKEKIVGCIAILGRSNEQAQLRWFLVHPDYQGIKLGKHLFSETLNFCKNTGYKWIYLWTLDHLTAAKKIYEDNGFKMKEQKRHDLWGHHLVEEYYVLNLPETYSGK